ncbi:MAG TPA: alpha-L-fucosidase [Jiangellaceae bacterium]|nr:alpha-L-fucosidase [Jiangellaceae bacterium]
MTFLPERTSLDTRPVPRWYTDAKVDIFVHWGLYSIPPSPKSPTRTSPRTCAS